MKSILSSAILICIILVTSGCAGKAGNRPSEVEDPIENVFLNAPLSESIVSERGYIPVDGGDERTPTAHAEVATPAHMAGGPVPGEPLSTPPGAFLTGASEAQSRGDMATMLSMLEVAASGGDAEAHYQLAKHYTQGTVVDPDVDKAQDHLNQAYAHGHAEAARVLGWQYIRGTNVAQDIPQGTAMLEQAAETSTRAMREAGLLFANVYAPHLNDPVKGRALLERASLAGDAESSRQLQALLVRQGDTEAAEEASAKAALSGSDAEMAEAAVSVEPESVKPLTVAEKAAQGDAQAMYEYANQYLLRKIKAGDPELEAYVWFTLAAEKGYQPAATEVQALAGVAVRTERQSPGLVDQMIVERRASMEGAQ